MEIAMADAVAMREAIENLEGLITHLGRHRQRGPRTDGSSWVVGSLSGAMTRWSSRCTSAS